MLDETAPPFILRGSRSLLHLCLVNGAQQSRAEPVAEIQAALRTAKLAGWLFYDSRHSDPLAYRI
jgi:hypothetical protein